jgi:hypothetical protein
MPPSNTSALSKQEGVIKIKFNLLSLTNYRILFADFATLQWNARLSVHNRI